MELLGALEKKEMKRNFFEGVLTLVGRDNQVLRAMVRTFRRWLNQFEDIDELWVPAEWNEFWGSAHWQTFLRRDELTAEEMLYVNVPTHCEVIFVTSGP